MSAFLSLDAASSMVLLVFVPLLGAMFCFLASLRSSLWILWLAVFSSLLLALLQLSSGVARTRVVHYAMGGWEPPLGIAFAADGFSLLLLWLTWFCGVCIGLYALGYWRERTARQHLFWSAFFVLIAALNALYLSADIFNLYITLELLTFASIALITLAATTPAFHASMRYLIAAMVGSLVYLLGVALAYAGAGTLNLYALGQNLDMSQPYAFAALGLMSCGLFIKSALFPLHFWLPPAHSSAPAPVSALLSALVVKGSLYLLIRLWFWPFAELNSVLTGQLIGLLGSCAILYGSLQALRQERLKLIIAYSTVAQLGYMLLLFPLATLVAWHGAMYQLLAHGLAKSALFLAAGNVILVNGHDRLEGLRMPHSHLAVSLFAFALGAISIMGLPPSGGFLAKWLLLRAAMNLGQWWWALVALMGGLLAAAYLFKVLRAIFMREADGSAISRSTATPVARIPFAMNAAPLILALGAIAMGFLGMPVFDMLTASFPVNMPGGAP
ncbi:hypothetical protein LGV61_09280 [Desulfurispirillum indicum]|uniref:complex I subunit 5 family protein n=1 Tax=Desulfurispirillum indicum TaxID=936456 RepID=UPI001CFA4865|nr:proton-conducting transporter membrane subunit [Desulfurispirillum indicum]UCZ55912.1 hypothetical protein LGV61_09280 [Desulfurispirillum indicum]